LILSIDWFYFVSMLSRIVIHKSSLNFDSLRGFTLPHTPYYSKTPIYPRLTALFSVFLKVAVNRDFTVHSRTVRPMTKSGKTQCFSISEHKRFTVIRRLIIVYGRVRKLNIGGKTFLVDEVANLANIQMYRVI
jgi:hypothetical protein